MAAWKIYKASGDLHVFESPQRGFQTFVNINFPKFTVSWKKKLYIMRDSMSIRLEIVMVITTVMMKNEDGSALEFMIM